jgi:hypothetical protein
MANQPASEIPHSETAGGWLNSAFILLFYREKMIRCSLLIIYFSFEWPASWER